MAPRGARARSKCKRSCKASKQHNKTETVMAQVLTLQRPCSSTKQASITSNDNHLLGYLLQEKGSSRRHNSAEQGTAFGKGALEATVGAQGSCTRRFEEISGRHEIALYRKA